MELVAGLGLGAVRLGQPFGAEPVARRDGPDWARS
jgi:hypothetical protein